MGDPQEKENKMLNLTPKERLVSYLPKQFKSYVEEFEREDGLIDDCKYMLYFAPNVAFNGYDSIPCKSYNEAQYFIRNATIKFQTLFEMCEQNLLQPMVVTVHDRRFFSGNGANILSVVDKEILKELTIVDVEYICGTIYVSTQGK